MPAPPSSLLGRFIRRYGERGADALRLRRRETYTDTGVPWLNTAANITGQIAGEIPLAVLAYKTGGVLGLKAGRKIPLLTRGRFGVEAARGAGAGAVHGTVKEMADTEKPLAERVLNVPREAAEHAALFAAGDVAGTALIGAAGRALKRWGGKQRFSMAPRIPALRFPGDDEKFKTPKQEASAILGTDDMKERIKGWRDVWKPALIRETMERNFESVMGKDAPEMIQKFIVPQRVSEASRQRRLVNERTAIGSFGIKARSKDSALLQKYGEKLISKDDLVAVAPHSWERIVAAERHFRETYDGLLDQMNAVLKRNKFEPVPKRKDYFRHMDDLGGVFEQLGVPRHLLDDLPTDVSGLTTDFKPHKSFFASALPRRGEKTVYDAITGIDGYLEGATRIIYHTDNIGRLRGLEEVLRESVAGTRHLTNFVSELSEFTNIVAGKKSAPDQFTENMFGAGVYRTIAALRRRVGANIIGGNLSTVVVQAIPVPLILATTSKRAVVSAAGDILLNAIRNDGFIKHSDFLTRRIGSSPLSLSWVAKGADAAFWPLRMVDRFASELAVRAKYNESIAKGLAPRAAMDAADDYAARLMADRSLGAMPTMFSSNMVNLFTMFQLEVNNQLSFILKDAPAMAGGAAVAASMIGQVLLYNHLFNNIYEIAVGRRPAFDPLGVAIRAAEDFNNPLITEDRARGNLLRSVGQQLPFVSTFLQGGRIPVTSAIPNPLAVMRGESSPAREAEKLWLSVPPFAGGQIRKTLSADKAALEGGRFTESGELMFPVEPSPRLFMFGPNITPEARQYFREGRRPLGRDQTTEWRFDGGDIDAYNRAIRRRGEESIERRVQKIVDNPSMSRQEKDDALRNLQRALSRLSNAP